MEQKTIPQTYAEGLKELRKNLKEMLPTDTLDTFDRDAETLGKTHQKALKLTAGEKAPDFELPNAIGSKVRLHQLLKTGRVVLTFYRGAWCPYCNLQLNQYQQALDQIKTLGAQLVAVSPQKADESLNMQEKNDLQFEVLSDVGNQISRQFTTVYKNADTAIDTMANLGVDFDAHYADGTREIPVPTVFIIEQNATISYAQSEGGDYRNRIEVSDIIQALQA